MAKVPTYQRTELPPGYSGQVKPTFDLADRGGQIQLAETVGGMAGDIWMKIIQARAANEFDDFKGVVDTQQALLEKRANDDPGAPIEKYKEWQNDMLAEIKKASGNATTRFAKERIRSWYAQNENLIRARSDASLAALASRREFDIFNLKRKDWIEKGNLNDLREGYQGVKGNLFESEQSDLLEREDTAELLEGVILRQALAMPGDEGFALIETANKEAKEQYQVEGELFSPDDIARMKKQYTYQKKAGAAKIAEVFEKAKNEAVQKWRDIIVIEGKMNNAIEIESDPALLDYPEEKDKLRALERERVTAILKSREGTPREIALAENENWEAINAVAAIGKQKALEVIAKNSDIVDSTSFVSALNKEAVEGMDEILKDGLAKAERMRRIAVEAAKKDLKKVEEKEDTYIKIFNDMRRNFSSNPEWTDKDKLSYIDTATEAQKDDAARNWFKLLWLTGFPGIVLERTITSYKKRQPKKEPKAIPLTEKPLSEMTDEELRAIIEGE